MKVILLGLIIPILFFSISLINIDDYSESSDDVPNFIIGDFYVNNWRKTGIAGLEQLLPVKDRYYGPFFNRLTIYSAKVFFENKRLLSRVGAWHLPIIVFSTISLLFIYFLAYQIWRKTHLALLTTFNLAIFPRFIGDSHLAPKDIPLLTMTVISLFIIYIVIKKHRYNLLPLVGLLSGLAFSIRLDGIFILFIMFFLVIITLKFNLKKIIKIIPLIIMTLAFFGLAVFIVWPYFRKDFLHRLIENIGIFKLFPWDFYVLYFGGHYPGLSVPWHYYFASILITTPLYLLMPAIFFTIYELRKLIKDKKIKDNTVFLFAWFLIPIIFHSFSKTAKYDLIRHIWISIPALILISTDGLYLIYEQLKKVKFKLSLVYLISVFILMMSALYYDIKIHPYQSIYYNQLVGGIKGAYGRFDLDYWGQSFSDAANWIEDNLPEGSKIRTVPPSEYFFHVNENKFLLVQDEADYEVVKMVGMSKNFKDDYLTTKQKVIYSVEVDSTPILKIFKK